MRLQAMKFEFLTKNIKQMMRFVVVALVMFSPTSQAFIQTDLLVIESIKSVKASGKIDSGSLAGFRALGKLLAKGATVSSKGEVVFGKGRASIVPVTVAAVEQAAAGGVKEAITAIKFMNSRFNGRDDLIVNVNGQRIVPDKGKFQRMKTGEVVKPAISVSFKKSVTISLIEYDTGTNNDDLGDITVNSDAFDKVKKGVSYRVEEAIVLGPRAKDGSLYYVTYHIERGKGYSNKVVKYLLCGMNECMECADSTCNIKYSGNLIGNKDKSKLRQCYSDFKHLRWKKHKQLWPAADVYLQVCKIAT